MVFARRHVSVLCCGMKGLGWCVYVGMGCAGLGGGEEVLWCGVFALVIIAGGFPWLVVDTGDVLLSESTLPEQKHSYHSFRSGDLAAVEWD